MGTSGIMKRVGAKTFKYLNGYSICTFGRFLLFQISKEQTPPSTPKVNHSPSHNPYLTPIIFFVNQSHPCFAHVPISHPHHPPSLLFGSSYINIKF